MVFTTIHISKRIEFRENSLFERILVEKKMSGAFTLLEINDGTDSSSSNDIRLPNVAVEITAGCRLCLEWTLCMQDT